MRLVTTRSHLLERRARGVGGLDAAAAAARKDGVHEHREHLRPTDRHNPHHITEFPAVTLRPTDTRPTSQQTTRCPQ